MNKTELNAMRVEVLRAYEFYYENTIDVYGGSDTGEIVIEEETEKLNETLGEIEKMYNHMFSIETYKYLEKKAKYNVETYMQEV